MPTDGMALDPETTPDEAHRAGFSAGLSTSAALLDMVNRRWTGLAFACLVLFAAGGFLRLGAWYWTAYAGMTAGILLMLAAHNIAAKSSVRRFVADVRAHSPLHEALSARLRALGIDARSIDRACRDAQLVAWYETLPEQLNVEQALALAFWAREGHPH